MEYTLDYFIEKFSAIPEDKWTTGIFNDGEGRCCAYGHCGVTNENGATVFDIPEGLALANIAPEILWVNDNLGGKFGEYNHLGTTPKERVVNYLKSLRNDTSNT